MSAQLQFLVGFEKFAHQAHRHEGGEGLHRRVERFDRLGQDGDLADRRLQGREIVAAEVLDLAHLERKLLQRRGDDARQEVDDADLQQDGDHAEQGQPLVLLVEGASEIGQRRDDEELPFLAEGRRQSRQARDIGLTGVLEREHLLVVARSGTEGDGRQIVADRGDVLQLDLAALGGIGLGAFGIGDHPALVVEDVGQRAGTDLALGEIVGKPVERDVRGGDATQLAIDIIGCADREAHETQRREDIDVAHRELAALLRGPIPEPRARVVGGGLLGAAELPPLLVEEQVVVDRRRPAPRRDPAVGIGRANRRQLALDLDIGIDLPGLAERAVGQADIDTDDSVAVLQDAEEILQRAAALIEVGFLATDRGGAPNQRFDRIEQILDVLDRLDAEPPDQLIGIVARDLLVRHEIDGDDRQEDRHRQQNEHRQDARTQPHVFREEAWHLRGEERPRGRSRHYK